MPGRLTVTVPRVDIGGNTLLHLHRVWLAHLDPPYSPQRKRTASQAIRESSTSNAATRSKRSPKGYPFPCNENPLLPYSVEKLQLNDTLAESRGGADYGMPASWPLAASISYHSPRVVPSCADCRPSGWCGCGGEAKYLTKLEKVAYTFRPANAFMQLQLTRRPHDDARKALRFRSGPVRPA